MTGHILYLIGAPGSGKSTLAAHLTARHRGLNFAKPFAHIHWQGPDGPDVVELGGRRDAFSGTDTLSMSVQPKVLQWLDDERPPLVLGEGDRLANLSFLAAAAGLGYDVHVVLLAASAAVAEHRRAARAAALGTPLQSAAWTKGRVTKVRNLADTVGATRLDADQPTSRVCTELLLTGDPVANALAWRPDTDLGATVEYARRRVASDS